MTILTTPLCFLLVACGQTSSDGDRLSRSETIQAPAPSANADLSSEVADWEGAGADNRRQTGEEDEGDYYAPSNYVKYPRNVRMLIRRADIENGHCRGGSGDVPETWRACNRRDRLIIELKEKGWCWGGSDVGYLEHWLKCADDPYNAQGGQADPRTVLTQHDPQGRLPNTKISKLGTIQVKTATYSIYYLDFSNPVSLHGLQQIAIIRNGTQFMGAYVCTLGEGEHEGKLFIGKDRLTVRIFGMAFVIRFNEKGPTRNKYFCGEGFGWDDAI